MNRPEITVIGLGGLGTALTKTLVRYDYPVKSLFNRTSEQAVSLAEELDISTCGTFPEKKSQLGDLVFITVSDRAISTIADRLADLSNDFAGYFFVHCSGNESADLLHSLNEKKGTIASFHPLQTFTRQSGQKTFKDIYFSMQGDEKAFPVLQELARQIGADSFEVTSKQKSHLHAAAVIASNYLITLLDASFETGAQSGLAKTQVQKALLPLIQTTLANASSGGVGNALTGPIERGDTETVQKHLALFEGQPELRKLYSELGLLTVQLAVASGSISEKTANKLRTILEGTHG